MSWHPRLSVNAICSMKQSFDDDVALWASINIDHVGLISPKFAAPGWDYCRDAIAENKLRISSMSCYRDTLAESIEFTAAVGSDTLYIVSGTGGSSLWEDSAARFVDDIAPFAARARELGVRLAIEPTNPLRTDVSFVHTVRDALAIAEMAGMHVVVDFYSSWYERDIARLVADNIDRVALVQVCDFKLGTFDMPNRVAIGDGNIPVERMLTMVLDAGYSGPFDLEILGPRIEEEGYRTPIVRSLERASELLSKLGV